MAEYSSCAWSANSMSMTPIARAEEVRLSGESQELHSDVKIGVSFLDSMLVKTNAKEGASKNMVSSGSAILAKRNSSLLVTWLPTFTYRRRSTLKLKIVTEPP